MGKGWGLIRRGSERTLEENSPRIVLKEGTQPQAWLWLLELAKKLEGRASGLGCLDGTLKEPGLVLLLLQTHSI